jgi:hypothetical protein
MVVMVERAKGHYEVQDVEFGRVYRWCPERVVAECGCGERTSLTASSSTTNCRRCGTDLAVVFLQNGPISERPGDETLRPRRYDVRREGAGLPC